MVQGDLVRDALTGVLEISRRMTDMSLKLVDDATRRERRETERHAA